MTKYDKIPFPCQDVTKFTLLTTCIVLDSVFLLQCCPVACHAAFKQLHTIKENWVEDVESYFIPNFAGDTYFKCFRYIEYLRHYILHILKTIH